MSDQPSTPPRLEDLTDWVTPVIDQAHDDNVSESHQEGFCKACAENHELLLGSPVAEAIMFYVDPLAVLTSMGAEVGTAMWSYAVGGYIPVTVHGEYVVIRKDALEGTE